MRSGQSTVELDQKIVVLKRAQRSRSQLQEGVLLAGRYRLIEVIGRGGFAKVWKAYDRQVRQQVAVKILHRDQGDEGRRIERFIRGARQMQRLDHPHVLRVLDGPAEYDGDHYFVMEFMPGGDLGHAVVQGQLDRKDALRIILQAGAALGHAHTRGLIHRDVKPQNILLDAQKRARLTDFDLVWTSDTTGGTRTSAMMGTFLYAAPEEIEDASRVDQRVDIYSLGMTVMFALHGRPLSRKVLDARALFIDGLDCPDAAKALLRRATALDPDDRPATVAELCAELTSTLGLGGPLSVRELPSPPESLSIPVVMAQPAKSAQAELPVLNKTVDSIGDLSRFLSKLLQAIRPGVLIVGLLTIASGIVGYTWSVTRTTPAPRRDDQLARIVPAPVDLMSGGAVKVTQLPPATHVPKLADVPDLAVTGNSSPSSSADATKPAESAPPKPSRLPADTLPTKLRPKINPPISATEKAVPTVNVIMRTKAVPAILRCYPAGSAEPGRFSVDMTIGANGQPTEVNVDGEAAYSGCILAVLRGLQFAPPTDGDAYSFRWDFAGARH